MRISRPKEENLKIETNYKIQEMIFDIVEDAELWE